MTRFIAGLKLYGQLKRRGQRDFRLRGVISWGRARLKTPQSSFAEYETMYGIERK